MVASDNLLGRRSRGHLGNVDLKATSLNIARTLRALDAVDTFADLIDEAITKSTNGSGHCDRRDVAAYILTRMSENQK